MTRCKNIIERFGNLDEAIDNDAKVKGISSLLKELGLEAASKDVSADNVEQYARFVLDDVKKRIVLTDPVTRKKITNKKIENIYKEMKKKLKKIGFEL